jgi:hypothetical protein
MIAYAYQQPPQHHPPSCPLSPLKYQRLLRGWSQKDVVDEVVRRCAESGVPNVGINVDQVRRWESRRCVPSPLYRKHLCMLYGLTAEQLGFFSVQEK